MRFPWLFVFIAVLPPRATVPGLMWERQDQGEPGAQVVLIATPSKVTESHRHQSYLIFGSSSSIWPPHNAASTLPSRRGLDRKAAEVAALLAGKLHGRDGGLCAGLLSRQRTVGACAERGTGLRAEAEADRGEGSEFLCCPVACSLLISRVIRSWPAVSFSTLRVICS